MPDDLYNPYTAPYLDLITWEHRRPKFTAAVEALLEGPTGVNALLTTYNALFDIDTAVGEQLDVVGEWVGHSRYIVTTLPNVYFTWDGRIPTGDGDSEPAGTVGWDEGVWWTPYQPATGYAVLDDDHYRVFLKAKIVANHWDGTIPGAYTAWESLFGPDGYHIIIQNGMAAATSTFTWDGEARQSWDRAAWHGYLTERANFIRNSAGEGAEVGGTVLPTYWSYYGNWSLSILELLVREAVDIVHIAFSGTASTDETLLWFETDARVALDPSDQNDWTFSVYFHQYHPLAAVTQIFVELVAYRAEGTERAVVSSEVNPQSEWGPTRYAVTLPFAERPDFTAYLRPRLRLVHTEGATATSYEIAVAAPQMEIGDTATAWIATHGAATVVYERAEIEPRVNGGMHMIYGLIAPYVLPPPPLEYFAWDSSLSALIVTWQADFTAATLLSSGLTLMSGVDGVDQSAFAGPGSAGKFYVEFTVRSGEAGNIAVGIGDDLALPAPLANPLGWRLGTGSSFGWYGNGSVATGQSASESGASLPGFGVGSSPVGGTDPLPGRGGIAGNWAAYGDNADGSDTTLCLAVDAVAKRIWGRVGTGSWNNNSSADPAANIGGFAIDGLSAPLHPGATLRNTGDAVEGRFAEYDWVYAPPAGFASLQPPLPQGANSALGWESGVWDHTPELVVAPLHDAVTMALFTGGHLDLRPAGVTMEYCIQSMISVPLFAWDAGPESVDDEAPVRAPPTYVSGWDIGAWPNFVDATRYSAAA